LARELGDVETQAAALNGIGNVQRVRGGLEAALSYHREALRLFQAIGAKPRAAELEETINKLKAEMRAAE
jgi:hypothetical protein